MDHNRGPAPLVHVRDASVRDAQSIAKIHIASWKATYPGIVPQTYLDSLTLTEFLERWQARLAEPAAAVIQVAELGGRVVGFAAGGPARQAIAGFSGELYAIYLAPTEKSKGIGSQLFWSIAQRIARSGYGGMYVWVLEQNPSRRFYERTGGVSLGREPLEIGGETLTQVSYGWPDLEASLRPRAEETASTPRRRHP